MLRIFTALLLVCSISACTIKPATDYILGHDFSQYKSFAFASPTEDETVSIDGSRIEKAVTQLLIQKGIKHTVPEQADLLVDYRIDSATELESYGSSLGIGVSRGRGRGIGTVAMSTPTHYRERKYGKIVIEFLNPENRSVVWHSISQSQLGETMGPEKRAEFIGTQVELMLSTYPPQGK
ncbi:DUF4136 domain-containing protein [Psychromonas aquimarina]|uniref:DUF4136 domain-containing protein n=1 Tax=Psychromonas aquimarina TaxID=444919 RepID=UPI00041DA2E9|nr:DUF4136 domain-containing protein [Psychromonas aquimarina]